MGPFSIIFIILAMVVGFFLASEFGWLGVILALPAGFMLGMLGAAMDDTL